MNQVYTNLSVCIHRVFLYQGNKSGKYQGLECVKYVMVTVFLLKKNGFQLGTVFPYYHVTA